MGINFNNRVLRQIPCERYVTYCFHLYRIIGNPQNVTRKVIDSDKCNSFIDLCVKSKITPTYSDLVSAILSSRNFAFSKAETICLASLFLLQRLMHRMDNSGLYPYEGLTSSRQVEFSAICVGIIKKCSEIKLGNRGFFSELITFSVSQFDSESNFDF